VTGRNIDFVWARNVYYFLSGGGTRTPAAEGAVWGGPFRAFPRAFWPPNINRATFFMNNTQVSLYRFLPRDAMLARYMLRPSVHLSVCLCLSQVGVLLKQITLTTPRDSPGDFSFLIPKILAKFHRDHPQGGAKCRWGRLKSATFDK